LAALLLAGHLIDIVFFTEHWPFSRYPMYSRLMSEPKLTKVRVYGVTDDGEVPLTAEPHFPPLTMSRLSAVVSRMGEYRNDSTKMSAAMGNLATIYERARRAGKHDGPKLKFLRVYAVSWTLKPWADNIEQPDKRVLLVEAQCSEG
jgi:hypothetical protein